MPKIKSGIYVVLQTNTLLKLQIWDENKRN